MSDMRTEGAFIDAVPMAVTEPMRQRTNLNADQFLVVFLMSAKQLFDLWS